MTEQNIGKSGQTQLIPVITLEGSWTMQDHATSERFHIELKKPVGIWNGALPVNLPPMIWD